MPRKKKVVPPSEIRHRNGKPLCVAKNNTCGAFAKRGYDKCHNHFGGGAAAGIQNIKHGLYSQHLPHDLLTAYEALKDDVELLDLREDIRLISSMALAELEAAKEGAPSLELWEQSNALYAQVMGGGPQSPAAMKELGKLLQAGLGKAQQIARAAKLVEQRTKTIQIRQKLELEAEATQTVAQAMAYTSALASGAKLIIEEADYLDRKAKVALLKSLALHIARTMRRSLGPGVDAGSVAIDGN